MPRRFARRFGSFLVFSILAPVAVAEPPLPAWVLEVPDTVTDVFIADTSAAALHRYVRDGDGMVPGGQTYISIGEKGVGKERAWDRRTPLGVYFVVDHLDTSRLHEKYGVTAFPLDYPNAWDRRQRRTGDGIWIHGVQPGGERRPPLDTDGCIALPNAELAALADRFVPLVTPVIVTRAMDWPEAGSAVRLRDELRQALELWSESIADADLHAYLAMYASDFRYRGLSLAEWAAFRLQTFAARGAADIEIDDVTLLADPEHSGVYLSRFRLTSTEGDKVTTTTKRLYWRRAGDGTWQIVAEDNG